MINSLRNWLLAKLFTDGFKEIEKTNWITKALEICYKNAMLKGVWVQFVDSVIGILKDAIGEAEDAKGWVK